MEIRRCTAGGIPDIPNLRIPSVSTPHAIEKQLSPSSLYFPDQTDFPVHRLVFQLAEVLETREMLTGILQGGACTQSQSTAGPVKGKSNDKRVPARSDG